MRKKIDNNNLLPYFTDNHEDLPQDYLEECEKFFKTLTKEKDDSTKQKRRDQRRAASENV